MNPFPNVPARFGRRTLPLAIAAALGAGLPALAGAQPFPAVIELSALDGSNGFVLHGEFAFDAAGISVSRAGDINGDGIGDLIVGAPGANPNGNASAGRSYLVFGRPDGLPNPFNLSTINGLNGIALNGAASGDAAGLPVGTAGDFNGDGIDDLFVSARMADPNGILAAGRIYVVFGRTDGLPHPFDLATLDGSNGVALDGEAVDDRAGHSVAPAGDVNGDGIDDLIIGAPGADLNGISYVGRSYVVFGRANGFPHPFELSSLDGSNGFALDGEFTYDRSGFSVAGVGDVNGDGIGDVMIGAYTADPDGIYSAGRSYVVFGSDAGLPNPFDLSTLNGLNGFVINGEAQSDRSGRSVSGAGDVNGDGIDDLIVGAAGADPNGNSSGRSYVVFGSDAGLPNPFDLSSINGLNGFALNGERGGDASGSSVSAAGDVNGDGIDDLIIGAIRADPNGNESAGTSYVVFGSNSGLPHPFELSGLDGNTGFALHGEAANDLSGFSVAGVGDVNGDGIDDVIVGAWGADLNGGLDAGRSYVVFGREEVFDLAVQKSNGAAFVAPGLPTTWFIEVSNPSQAAVSGAALSDPVPAGVTGAAWTCTGFDGAVCANASGNGGIDELVDLPAGASLVYELTATVTAIEGQIVTNTATITLAFGQTDINPGNNSATDADPVGLFADGFETE